ncbi:MAG: hypothetical protein ACJ75B_15955 [Flavisolibacter sp.]
MKYLMAIALCLMISCKKSNNNEPSKTDTISEKPWKFSSGGIDYNKDGTVDLNFSTLAIIPPCVLDNTASFKSDGTGIADEGATKCDPANPQTSSFTWKFTNNDQSIQIGGNGLLGTGGEFRILVLNSSTFSLSKDTTISLNGIPPSAVSIIVNLQH